MYVSSELGGMSGAQPKASVIADAISVTTKIDLSAVKKRHEQGWVDEVVSDLDPIKLVYIILSMVDTILFN